MGSMKVRQFARGFWEHEPTSLTLGCKRLRPLAPKLPANPDTTNIAAAAAVAAAFDLKSFIRPESAPIKLAAPEDNKKDSSPQVETHPGGTRWNPTQEQIGILERLYKDGMRTPNAQQIEQITTQLRKYGKIEGKNVFYWFQNHKARERQKQKRYNLGLAQGPRSPTATSSSNTISLDTMGELVEREEDSPHKKCRKWASQCLEDEYKTLKVVQHRTLDLFPLHPEGR